MGAALAVAAVGCGPQQTANLDDFDWSTVKIVEEPTKLTYWVKNDMSGSVENYADNAAYKELERRTGVTIEFMHPTGDQNQLEMLIAANTLPDIVERVTMNSLPGGGDVCIEDGVIIRLNELIDEHAPNFKAARTADKESERLTITDMGNIYAFPKLLDAEELAWSGIRIRKDLLDQLNLDVPETIDDWYEVLTAFKDAGVEIPLTIGNGGWDTTTEFGAFIGAWGVNRKFILNDAGEVIYGAIQPGYREFLTTMRKWYEEGLLDPQFDKRTDTGDLTKAGKIGAAVQTGFGDYEVVAAPYPKLNDDTEVNFRQKNWRNRGYEASITTACTNPEVAVKWFDYHYDQSPTGGARLFDWGILDTSYTMYTGSAVSEAMATLESFFGKQSEEAKSEGYPIATPAVTADGANGPVIDWTEVNKYKIDNGPYLKDVDRVLAASPETIVNENYLTWSKAGTKYMLPNYTKTDEEKLESDEIMSAVNSYVSEMYFKFITGEESMDKWDDYVAQIRSMGINRATEIEAAAYARMMSR